MSTKNNRSYSLDEVIKSSEEYFNGDTLAATVWAKKYAEKTVDNFGNEVYYEKTPEDMHHRLAKSYANIETKYGGKNKMSEEEIFELFDHFKYIIPQGSPMSAVGTDKIISTANCFVIGNDRFTDSYGGIMRVDEMLVQLSKRRAGVGTSLDDIRPKNMIVNNSAGTAPGVATYMERYSNTIREVSQNNRRGALMLSINCKHPDVEDFIDIKMEEGKVTGANISVQITDDFMEAVKTDSDFELKYPIYSNNPKLTKIVKARDIWNKIVHNAWKSAEPGVMFWDTVIRESIPDCYADLGFKTVTTNPCLTGDTIISVADGRNEVTIKQLSEEGTTFPIYSVRKNNSIGNKSIFPVTEVKTAIAFKTGVKKTIKVHLSDGSSFRCTPDHRLGRPDLTYVEAKDSLGIELCRFDKKYSQTIEESSYSNKLESAVYVSSIDFDYVEEEVFDITVEDNHNFFIITKSDTNNYLNSSGVLVHNCGEIPLNNGDSCRLTACNLSSYVVNPFTENAYFNFDLFKSHIYKAMRLMDDLVDIEEEHINRILNKIKEDPEEDNIKRNELELWNIILTKLKQGRRAGLGITAEGDMLAMMNLTYGTKEANEFSEEVQKQLCLSAYRSSVDLAKERGAFPIYDSNREINNPFIQRIKEADNELYEDMVKFGRRNIACLTIAPTGSVSILTETTSGVEPLFMPAYKRRRKINSELDMDSLKGSERNIIVDEVGDKFEEYIVYHPKLKEWMKLKGYDYNKDYSTEELNNIVQQSPYYKATSSDVDWLSKVDLQGRLQKWVDHSISVTVNLPENVSEELISDLYFRAWETGCKGLTIYREGSRNGVLVSLENKDKDKNKEDNQNNNEEKEIIGTYEKVSVPKIKRPFELEARIVRFQNNKEKWIAFVGLRDKKPYEIFTGIDDEDEGLFIPKSVTEGKILKIHNEDGTKRYDFVYKNKKGIETIVSGLNTKFNPEFWNYAIFISGILRYQMPIEEVVKLIQTLDLNDDNINTWKNGVVRALKKYIPNGVEARGVKCPECGQETLIYQEGCLICTSCGMSKCG